MTDSRLRSVLIERMGRQEVEEGGGVDIWRVGGGVVYAAKSDNYR